MARRGPDLVGRERLLGRLTGALDRAMDGDRTAVLLAGEGGIGKTSLLGAGAAYAAARGALVVWGTCVDLEGAPGFWPWKQAFDELVRALGRDTAGALAGDDATLVASIAPELGAAGTGEPADRDRLVAIDATSRFLNRVAAAQPLVVILDDLHWADESSLALLEFVVGAPQPAPIALLGAFRHDELTPAASARLARLTTKSEHIEVGGIDADAVALLVARVTDAAVEPDVAAAIHRRTGGHPVFVRELALLADTGSIDQVPGAVRDAIGRRVARLPPAVTEVLEVGAVLGVEVEPAVIATALDRPAAAVEEDIRRAVHAGLLLATPDGIQFAHDLAREAVLARLEVPRRVALHQAVGTALEARAGQGIDVAAAELARHFVAAIPLDGTARAMRWALAASAADRASLAFTEAGDHRRRVRIAAADAGMALADADLFELLLNESDARSRAGRTLDARSLLRQAADVATRLGDAEATARVAMAGAQLGAKAMTRRDDAVRELESALAAVAGKSDRWEARLAATLAREMQHSVPEDRPRAEPLSQRALELGRRSDDPATLVDCLLARHDVLWTPGTAGERADLAQEMIAVARSAGDRERQAQGCLLLANARLELGSPAWSVSLDECIDLLASLGGARHRYTIRTRLACRALLQGDLDAGAELLEEAAAFGERILEPDAGNVRMSQRLELVRARGDPDGLQTFAVDAVAHWTGAAVHAHAVAAGFLARAGDLGGARPHVAAVVELGGGRADRSYLWSVFIRELAVAAIALDDRDLCRQIADDVRPVRTACGVNGAAVAFAGSLAHTAGNLAAYLGDPEAGSLLAEAAATYRALGAVGWLAEIDARPARRVAEPARPAAAMRRRGQVWQLVYGGREVTVPHSKGLHDLARLVAANGAELHALDLAGSSDRSGASGPMADAQAVAAYRRRLADLDDAIDEAVADNDPERRARAELEREALIAELSRVLATGNKARSFANHPAERARKAVTARIRDAIRKLELPMPELAAHLEQSVVTGNFCRYRPGSEAWHVDLGSGD